MGLENGTEKRIVLMGFDLGNQPNVRINNIHLQKMNKIHGDGRTINMKNLQLNLHMKFWIGVTIGKNVFFTRILKIKTILSVTHFVWRAGPNSMVTINNLRHRSM